MNTPKISPCEREFRAMLKDPRLLSVADIVEFTGMSKRYVENMVKQFEVTRLGRCKRYKSREVAHYLAENSFEL